MPKNEIFVVFNPTTGLYLTSYNQRNPPDSLFGNLVNAIKLDTLLDAETKAAAIGGGTVGTPKPKN